MENYNFFKKFDDIIDGREGMIMQKTIEKRKSVVATRYVTASSYGYDPSVSLKEKLGDSFEKYFAFTREAIKKHLMKEKSAEYGEILPRVFEKNDFSDSAYRILDSAIEYSEEYLGNLNALESAIVAEMGADYDLENEFLDTVDRCK